ncbi:MAG: hypothetical protein KDA37_08600, partial [Planctomycetales bacterium]|nr:hypothetical protein [Planctomycetales bacterium]
MRRNTTVLVGLAVAGLAGACSAEPAAFWLSTSAEDPNAPAKAEFVSAIGVPRAMHIWAQPRTKLGLPWNAVANPYLTMQNVSLNVVSPQTAFTIDSVVVHNPVYLSGKPRFGGVDDSSTGLVVS